MLQLDVDGTIQRIVNTTAGGDMVAIVANTVIITDDTTDDDQTTDGQTGQTGQGNQDDQTDGDATIADTYGLDLIQINGHLGWTETITGQRIETALLSPAVEASTNPIGDQTTGLVSANGIRNIILTGGMGHANIGGSVSLIQLNSDNSLTNTQFEGLFGSVLIAGNLNHIELGDGIQDPGRGYWAQAGLFVRGDLNTVEISGPGNDINGPILVTR